MGADISVVVPAYNEQARLCRSLSSLRHARLYLADTVPAATSELLVVDNASTDATATTATRFGAIVVSEQRRGVAIARNTGGRRANGALLAFVDADYRVPIDFLTTLVRRFAADPGLTAAGARVVLEPGEIDPVRRWCAAHALDTLRKFRSMAFGVFVMRRDWFDRCAGFDESLFAYEDVELLRRVHRDPAARYRVLPDLKVYASARGFYRGGMLRTYWRMAVSPSSRTRFDRCGYWYDR
ncbi:glycosyltransferase [Actinoplanes sp. NPDC051861]|uniref:glycosyltransferase n=1 Tax=Actinoplanes sp. NPDC051861 TaxID=3155170 RepID=UPI003443AEF6